MSVPYSEGKKRAIWDSEAHLMLELLDPNFRLDLETYSGIWVSIAPRPTAETTVSIPGVR